MGDTRYCPNCVSEMQKDKRKLGKTQDFFTCPSCGVREQANEPQESLIIKTSKNERRTADNDDVIGESSSDEDLHEEEFGNDPWGVETDS